MRGTVRVDLEMSGEHVGPVVGTEPLNDRYGTGTVSTTIKVDRPETLHARCAAPLRHLPILIDLKPISTSSTFVRVRVRRYRTVGANPLGLHFIDRHISKFNLAYRTKANVGLRSGHVGHDATSVLLKHSCLSSRLPESGPSGTLGRTSASVKACVTPALARRWSRTSAASGRVLHKPRGRKPRRTPRWSSSAAVMAIGPCRRFSPATSGWPSTR